MGDAIKQTNRAILMDVINPEKMDILTLVGDVRGMESLTDDKIKEINDHLLVHSFDEMLEKFNPTVYCYYDAANQKEVYLAEKPEGIPEAMLTEIPLNRNNEFVNMLMSMIAAKRSEGSINVDFKFEKITEMISPRKVMESIKQNRKELLYTYGEYAKLDEGNPKKKDLADTLNVMFEEASANYNNLNAMLPLLIEDVKTRLLLGVDNDKKDNAPLALGVLSMGENGELKVLEGPKVETTELATVDDEVNTGLIEALKDDYAALNEDSNDYVKELVARTFCPLSSTMESGIDREQEVENYNAYLEFYRDSKNRFINVVKPLLEKLLGVWCFFEQCPKKVKGMRPSLLIANQPNEMLAKASNIPRLITYLNTTNGKNDFSNTVWYAIVPDVSLDQYSKMKLSRERFQGNSKVEKNYTNSVESLSRILDVCKEYEIQCFFSYETGESATFSSLATEGIEKYEERCTPLTGKPFSEYAIPCLPNFTVIPKDRSGIVLDRRMVINEDSIALSEEKEDVMQLWIEGVYIGAAYVAAGLVAAYQSPEYLKEILKKDIDIDLPGVRFDVESGKNALQIKTTMAKEITGFTNSIKNDINRKNFGFIFSSENAIYDGHEVTNIMVYKARNLQRDDNNSYEPVYKTQTTTYMKRVLRHDTEDFKEDAIIEFFSSNPASRKSKWLAKKDCINAILKQGDDITYEIDGKNGYCSLNISFGGNQRNLEVETNRMSNQA